MTDRNGYVGTLGDRHFTVELPWEAGAKTNLIRQEEFRKNLPWLKDVSEEQIERMAGKTSFLEILVTDHPLYGKGVRSTLELPFSPDDPATVQMVNELNAWELSGSDLPPHFGAWCIGNRAPAKWSDIFTDRQLVALSTFSELMQQVRERVKHDASAANFSDDGKSIVVGGRQ